MASLKFFIFLAMTSLFFSGSHADSALIDGICKRTQDYNFCSTSLNNDPRSVNADLKGLCLISISITIMQIQSTLDRIPGILGTLTDPLGKQRLGACQNDYSTSLGNFQNSFSSASAHDYWKTFDSVKDGTNHVIDCHNSYRTGGPIATSPIDVDDNNVIKLSEIILIIVNDLISGSAASSLLKAPVHLPVHR
ncbi:Pectinesterase inhibitor [Corchorus capsularis]|uniref:Pectinesterase inhibitor n=1 Tax=Corchorus capsularis TaxID=210143 RepID=A0A1R3H128_COCAP|nr:Pectinesterase inhibitor [Corchorus capsularis]